MMNTFEYNNRDATTEAEARSKTIILAGATGNLGQKIAAYLLQSGATVKALVRTKAAIKLDILQNKGLQVTEVDFFNRTALMEACAGGTCFVSAVSGLKEVIVDVQSALLSAAIEVGIPRFIPSDYCIDYTKLVSGSNRNLDLRREFGERLHSSTITATSIFSGMFMDLLTGQAPLILPGIKRVMYWGNADQPLDFTTIENTAEYTAAVAIDSSTPRYLRIAGDVATITQLQAAASDAMGIHFKRLRLGNLSTFNAMISATRLLFPQKKEVFPAWQGMQYLHNMFTGLPKLTPLDNDRYAGIDWTSVRELLERAK